MIDRREFLSWSAFIAGLSIAGSAYALPAPAFAENESDSFIDQYGQNGVIDCSVDWADVTSSLIGIGLVPAGVSATTNLLKDSTTEVPTPNYFETIQWLNSLSLLFSEIPNEDLTWQGENKMTSENDPPLYAKWGYDASNIRTNIDFLGCTNDAVAEFIANSTQLNPNGLSSTLWKLRAKMLFGVQPKANGKCVFCFGLSVPTAYEGLNTSRSVWKKTYEVVTLEIVVDDPSGVSASTVWTSLGDQQLIKPVHPVETNITQAFLRVGIPDTSNGLDPFGDYTENTVNSLFSEYRTTSVIDPCNPVIKVEYYCGNGITIMPGENEVLASHWFANKIFPHILLVDSALVDDGSISGLNPKNVIASYKMGNMVLVNEDAAKGISPADLVALGADDALLRKPSDGEYSSYNVSSGTILFSGVNLLADHEYALFFSFLPYIGKPYFYNETKPANSVVSVADKSVLIRFRTMREATSLELDKHEVVLRVPGEGEPEMAVLQAMLKNGETAAGGNVKWTSTDSTSKKAKLSSRTTNPVTLAAVGEGTLSITAQAYDSAGAKIDGASDSCRVIVCYPLTSVELDVHSYVLSTNNKAYDFYTFKPTYKYGDITATCGVGWTSSNPDVATVDTYGKVKQVSAGVATITATALFPSADGTYASDSCEVTVMPWTQSMTLSETEIDLPAPQQQGAGATFTLLATTYVGETATNDPVKWTSSNEDVATVDDNGVVTAVGPGSATITVSAVYSLSLGLKQTCTVNVIPCATSVELDTASVTLNAPTSAGEAGSYALSATLGFAAGQQNVGNKVGVTWASSNENVATVTSEGIVTAVAAGTATIKATATYPTDGSVYATCSVKVTTTDPSISLDAESLEIASGATATLVAAWLNPTSTIEAGGMTWTSDDPSVVSVDAAGKVTGVSGGSATITVSSKVVPSIKTTCAVLVRVMPATLALNTTELMLETPKLKSESTTAALAATLLDAKGVVAVEGSLMWASSDQNVIAVSAEGTDAHLTVVGPGSATVTVSFVKPEDTTLTTWPVLSQTCAVSVADVTPASIALAEGDASLVMEAPVDGVFATYALAATVLNAAGAPLSDAVTWRSSNDDVAMVDESGFVTATGEGMATISATCYDAMEANCAVSVHALPTQLQLDVEAEMEDAFANILQGAASVSLVKGDRLALPPLAMNGKCERIEWTSTDPNVLAVDVIGSAVNAVGVGEVDITATPVFAGTNIVPTSATGSQEVRPLAALMMRTLGAADPDGADGAYTPPTYSFHAVVGAAPDVPKDDGEGNSPNPPSGSNTGDGNGGSGSGGSINGGSGFYGGGSGSGNAGAGNGSTNGTGGGSAQTTSTPGGSSSTKQAGASTATTSSSGSTGLVKTGDSIAALLTVSAVSAVVGAGMYAWSKVSDSDKVAAAEGVSDFGSFVESAAGKLGRSVARMQASLASACGFDGVAESPERDSVLEGLPAIDVEGEGGSTCDAPIGSYDIEEAIYLMNEDDDPDLL